MTARAGAGIVLLSTSSSSMARPSRQAGSRRCPSAASGGMRASTACSTAVWLRTGERPQRRGDDVLGLCELRHEAQPFRHRMPGGQSLQPGCAAGEPCRGIGQDQRFRRFHAAERIAGPRCPSARPRPVSCARPHAAASPPAAARPRARRRQAVAAICGDAARPSPASHSPASSRGPSL